MPPIMHKVIDKAVSHFQPTISTSYQIVRSLTFAEHFIGRPCSKNEYTRDWALLGTRTRRNVFFFVVQARCCSVHTIL